MKKFFTSTLAILIGLTLLIVLYFIFLSILSSSTNFSATSNNQEVIAGQDTSTPLPLPLPVPTKDPVTLTIAGDVMLDRDIWAKMQRFGINYPFAKIPEFFSSDINFVNLEGPITNRGQHALPYGLLTFKFDPSVTPTLKNNNINLVSLANNHSLDQGEQGYLDTIANLAENDIKYFGHEAKLTKDLVHIEEVKGWKLAFIGWNEVDDPGSANYQTLLQLIPEVGQEVDFIFVLPHWGAEYQGQGERQKSRARAIIDAGADVIIGTHPHVIQGFETHNNKPIFYSLGNFIFDQYWSEQTQRGIALKMELSEEQISFEIIPIHLPLGQPVIATGNLETQIFQRLKSLTPSEFHGEIDSKNISVAR